MNRPEIIHGLLKGRTLYVSDLDGTLLNTHSRVSSESARILNELISSGTLFTVATARTPATVVPLMQEVKMQLPGVVMTGASLFNFATHKFSRLQYIAPGVVDNILKKYREFRLGTFVYTFNGERLDVYHIGELNELEHGFILERSGTPAKTFHVPEHGESTLPESLDNTVLLYSVQPWQPACSLYEWVRKENLPVNPLCYHDTFSEEWGQLEVFSETADKAKAIEYIASQVRADRIVAYGDNVNDMPLFALADEGIAVANAVDELKACASEVIDCNDADSVARHIFLRSK